MRRGTHQQHSGGHSRPGPAADRVLLRWLGAGHERERLPRRSTCCVHLTPACAKTPQAALHQLTLGTVGLKGGGVCSASQHRPRRPACTPHPQVTATVHGASASSNYSIWTNNTHCVVNGTSTGNSTLAAATWICTFNTNNVSDGIPNDRRQATFYAKLASDATDNGNIAYTIVPTWLDVPRISFVSAVQDPTAYVVTDVTAPIAYTVSGHARVVPRVTVQPTGPWTLIHTNRPPPRMPQVTFNYSGVTDASDARISVPVNCALNSTDDGLDAAGEDYASPGTQYLCTYANRSMVPTTPQNWTVHANTSGEQAGNARLLNVRDMLQTQAD